jgi:uncharacterized delta-60 repeat protein
MKLFTTIFAILALVCTTFAQPGDIDLSFNPSDIGYGNGDGPSGEGITLVQSDGKIILFTGVTYNGIPINRIARINTDGTLDSTFNSGTGPSNGIISAFIQSDGKIVIVGGFLSYNGTLRNYIARINTDGSLDNTFDPGIGANDVIFTTSYQNDGKIIIGGLFTSFNGTPINRIARLNVDGSLDATFDLGTGPNNTVWNVFSQSDGKTIIGGDFTSYNSSLINRIARLNADGTLDTTFNPGLGANNTIRATSLQNDGKLIIGGDFTSYNATLINRIARINIDGTLDTTFNSGTGANNSVRSILIQSDGKIIIGGGFSLFNGSTSNCIVRVNINGSLDPTFDPGSGANGNVNSLSIQSDGKIIIGGGFTVYNGIAINYFIRANSDGTLDTTFNPGTGASNAIFSTCIQSDGKLIIGGDFSFYNGTIRNRIARINLDGTLDTTFNPGAGANNSVRSISIQSDGKIIIGGLFTSYNGITTNRIARINSDGTLDVTFNPGTGANNNIHTTSIQSDGKIIICGIFTTYNGTTKNRIARLNADGTLDVTFNSGGGANNTIYYSTIQSDGKIIICGIFTTYNGASKNRIARINVDGTVDVTFNTGVGANNTVYTTCIQSDGKIIIGGAFTSYNGTTMYRVARINADGSLDSTFDPIGGANNPISTTSIQSDGKIIIGGVFTYFNGIPINRIARINTDGTLDTTFNSGTGVNDFVNASSIQNDGKIIIGGFFTSYNGTGRNRIVRIHNNVINTSNFVPDEYCTEASLPVSYTATGFYSVGNVFTAQLSDSTGSFASPTDIGTLSSTTNGTITSTIPIYQPSGAGYRIRVVSSDPPVAGSDNGANITIHSTTSTTNVTECYSYTWTDGNTYTVSGQYVDTIPNTLGCDSIITLNLTIVPSQPLILENSFSLPSDVNNCVGQTAITVSGNEDFELDIDNGLQIINTSGFTILDNLCPGVHDLKVTDMCGDTLHSTIIIPIDSNYIFNNPFIDSLAVDSLGFTLSNCTIYYNSIDTAYIDSIWSVGNTVTVIWNIIDSSGSNFDTTSYVLNNGNGVYLLQLSLFCPTKALGDYFAVTQAIYFEDGNVYVVGIDDKELNYISVHPNPTTDYVLIMSANEEIKRIIIYDVFGKEIQNENQKGNTYKISLSDNPSGVYLFRVMTSKGEIVKRIIKQ